MSRRCSAVWSSCSVVWSLGGRLGGAGVYVHSPGMDLLHAAIQLLGQVTTREVDVGQCRLGAAVASTGAAWCGSSTSADRRRERAAGPPSGRSPTHTAQRAALRPVTLPPPCVDNLSQVPEPHGRRAMPSRRSKTSRTIIVSVGRRTTDAHHATRGAARGDHRRPRRPARPSRRGDVPALVALITAAEPLANLTRRSRARRRAHRQAGVVLRPLRLHVGMIRSGRIASTDPPAALRRSTVCGMSSVMTADVRRVCPCGRLYRVLRGWPRGRSRVRSPPSAKNSPGESRHKSVDRIHVTLCPWFRGHPAPPVTLKAV